jgi:hypothetical protein
LLRGAKVTADACPVGAVVYVQARNMKQPWCSATNLADANARALINLYGKRWGIEQRFRDAKNPRFGMGMGAIRVSTPARRSATTAI